MTLNNIIYDILNYVAENDRVDLLNRNVLNIDIDNDGIHIQTDKDTDTIWFDN